MLTLGLKLSILLQMQSLKQKFELGLSWIWYTTLPNKWFGKNANKNAIDDWNVRKLFVLKVSIWLSSSWSISFP